MNQDKVITPQIVPLPKQCPMCKMDLPVGAGHLARQSCIADLQQAIAQMAALLGQEQAKIGQLTTTSRIGWILVDKMEGKRRIFTAEELRMPRGAQLHAEATPEGLVVTAIVKPPVGEKSQ